MPPRILLIRPDHLGDVLLTLPAVAGLRRALPGARLAYALPPAAAAVARHCPDLDATLSIDVAAAGAVTAERLRRFDAALVPRPDDPWSGRLVAAAGIPIRIGFDMPRTRPYLTDVLPVPRGQHVSTDPIQLADALLARLGVRSHLERGLEAAFVTTAADADEAEAALRETGAEEHPIVLHPGSGWPLKNWPARRWRRLAAELAKRFRTAPVVAGSGGEAGLVGSIVGPGTPAIALAGRLSLGALAALHRRARLVIGVDSGALHLAAAMGAPVVALFGPADPVMFAPLCPPARLRIVHAGLACSPCGTLEHPPCGATSNPECMAAIDVGAVLQAAAELLRPRT
jgi:ADP-heptose:LPS heptosyltransferase